VRGSGCLCSPASLHATQRALITCAWLFCACAETPVAPPISTNRLESPADSEPAPTPYTALELRKAISAGRTYEYHVEEAGQPERWVILKFTRVVETDADVVRLVVDAQGRPLQPSETSLVTWDELRRHAEFPRSAVEIDEAQLTVPIGIFDCLRYTVKSNPETVLHFYFAKTLPGPPIYSDVEVNGRRHKTSTLIRYLPGR